MKKCSSCGSVHKDEARFCTKCGASLPAASTATVVDSCAASETSVSEKTSPDSAPARPARKPLVTSVIKPAEKSGRGLVIGLIAGGVLLVVAIVLICVFVLGGDEKGADGRPRKVLEKVFRKDIKYETITDARDQQKYRTVTVGNQVWMAQNLNFAAEESFCEECEYYGRTYSWNAALNSCPEGFVLPSMRDFQILMDRLQGVDSYKATRGWASAGMDAAGIAVLPAGFRSFKDNVMKRRDEMAGFWSRANDGKFAMRLKVDGKNGVVSQDGLEMDYGFSVRCISRSSSVEDSFDFMVDSRTGKPRPTVKIGEQVWLQDNMDYVSSKMKKNYCYDDLESNCEQFGRLYEWGDAVNACPAGSRLPNAKDFETLAKSLKSIQNIEKFQPTYAGIKNKNGEYESQFIRASYWSSSEVSGVGKYWYLSVDKQAMANGKYSKKGAMLVRCIRDSLEIPYESDFMTDYRDGRVYNTVKIGAQTWMAENMKYVTEGSGCYDNERENCEIFGRLYSWSDAYEACPEGYHMPDDDDWTKLKNFLSDNGDGKLSSILKSDDYWKNPGKNTVGMNIRPSGYYDSEGAKFGRLGERAYLWSASMKNWDSAYHWSLSEGSEIFGKSVAYKENARPVRCVKD